MLMAINPDHKYYYLVSRFMEYFSLGGNGLQTGLYTKSIHQHEFTLIRLIHVVMEGKTVAKIELANPPQKT